MNNNILTYISLFSSAGVGCFGFKQEGFECIATNELIERRLKIQRINHKCRFDKGYIQGDIKLSKIKDLLYSEIKRWNKIGNDRVDVLIATPPCQGMSVANHKKSVNDINRNSLVVESINIVNKIHPRFFIFENVPAFWKTGCINSKGEIKAIGEVISEELSTDYIISNRVINFKNYGSNSSRIRTVVIGVSKELSNYISPVELYPDYKKEKTLYEVIGNKNSLSWGEFDPDDFYHQFRTYPKHMRDWIHDLPEGGCAFNNSDNLKKPHRVVNGKIVINKAKNADKYTRQIWGKAAPCIHTRNDQLASQNTVHPSEDRVFSIRELMEMMTIPYDFRWIDKSLEELNELSNDEKRAILKKEEMNIRQCIGEAVPTEIFRQIASKIYSFMNEKHFSEKQINKFIKEKNLTNINNLLKFVKQYKEEICFSSLSSIIELANAQRKSNSAYFTNKFIIHEIAKDLPPYSKDKMVIVEPSVGAGNFLPFIIKTYEHVKQVDVYLVDIDITIQKLLSIIITKLNIPKNFKLHLVNKDYLKCNIPRANLTIGNPPFTKLKSKELKPYINNNVNKKSSNLAEFFLEKAVRNSDYVCLIMPKSLLNTPEFIDTRKYINKFSVENIKDFGEKGFKGVLVETISIQINTKSIPKYTNVYSMTRDINIKQRQHYITDEKFPYWIIYRNEFFDSIAHKIKFDVFDVFRDRQLTNSNTHSGKKKGDIRVVKSRNIDDNGIIIDIPGYDSWINKDVLTECQVEKFLDDDTVYMTPNMTYKPRLAKKEKGYVVNGSVAILKLKKQMEITERQCKYISSNEYRKFYQIARNYQTRSLNIDSTSCFWFGLLKEKE